MRNALVAKMSGLEKAIQYDADNARLTSLHSAIYRNLEALSHIQINISVLKFTSLGKDMKVIAKNKQGIFNQECIALANQLIVKWTDEIKQEEETSIIYTRKGGKVVEVPNDLYMLNTKGYIPRHLWKNIVAEYNMSQLFAISYVAEQFHRLEDTKVVLIQGNSPYI
jgi:hypothetical protein